MKLTKPAQAIELRSLSALLSERCTAVAEGLVRKVLVFAGVLFLLGGSLEAQQGLAGLPGVEVFVIPAAPSGPGAPTKGALTADIERELRAGGIAVRRGQDLNDPHGIWLHVELSVTAGPEGWSAYSVQASLRQACHLSRKPATELLAATWHASSGGLTRTSRLGDAVLDAVRTVTKTFVEQYKDENSWVGDRPVAPGR